MAGTPTSTVTDSPESLVQRAVRGDEAAFARIVRLHHVDMVRTCFVVCGDAELAEAAAAAAWPVAWRRLRTLREPDRLRSWLCALAADEARSLVHRRRAAIATTTAHDPGDARGAWSELVRRLRRRPATRAAEETWSEAELEQRLRALPDIPVKPVDIDRVARVAKAEHVASRTLLASVIVAAIVAAIYFALVDYASMGARQAATPSLGSPTAAPGASSLRVLSGLSDTGPSGSIGKTPGGRDPWRSMSL